MAAITRAMLEIQNARSAMLRRRLSSAVPVSLTKGPMILMGPSMMKSRVNTWLMGWIRCVPGATDCACVRATEARRTTGVSKDIPAMTFALFNMCSSFSGPAASGFISQQIVRGESTDFGHTEIRNDGMSQSRWANVNEGGHGTRHIMAHSALRRKDGAWLHPAQRRASI